MPVSFGYVRGDIVLDIIFTCFLQLLYFFPIFSLLFSKFFFFFFTVSLISSRTGQVISNASLLTVFIGSWIEKLSNFYLFLSISADENSGCCILFLWETENLMFLSSFTCSSCNWLSTRSSNPDKLTVQLHGRTDRTSSHLNLNIIYPVFIVYSTLFNPFFKSIFSFYMYL